MEITEEITKIVKIDKDNISIDKTDTIVSSVNYNYKFLVQQRLNIVADSIAYAAARQKEIARIDLLLAKCAEVGVGG